MTKKNRGLVSKLMAARFRSSKVSRRERRRRKCCCDVADEAEMPLTMITFVNKDGRIAQAATSEK